MKKANAVLDNAERRGSKPPQMSRYDGFDTMPIGAKWRAGKSKDTLCDRNPFTGETILEIVQANEGDVDEAYMRARAAQPEWAAAPPSARATVMQKAAQVMQARRDEIIGWLIAESGSTRLKASLEWDAVHAVMLQAAAMPYMVEGAILPSDIPEKECRVYRKAVGVVGVISPWNWPLQLSNRSVAPALAVGNAVVLKPSSDTPVTGGLLLAKIFQEAGLPPGLLSVVVGSGGGIGDAFAKHDVPRVISFTGSTEVGRTVAKAALDSKLFKRFELELGGNSPFVVLEDADIEQAVEAAIFGKFLHQGQICMIANRFIIVGEVYDEFAERFTERARKLKVGDPNDPDTMIGPIVNEKQAEKIQKLIEGARDDGAKELLGGAPKGLVIPPHVFADIGADMEIAQNEIFGPVATLIRARDEDDALHIANDTMQGLSASVFTSDLARGACFAARIESGMAHVNDQPVNDLPNNPFGGEKNSGIGRFGGRWAVDAFTTDQWITVQHAPRRFPHSARDVEGPGGGG
jgi:aldehyde dehydrogenase (NAD+)